MSSLINVKEYNMHNIANIYNFILNLKASPSITLSGYVQAGSEGFEYWPEKIGRICHGSLQVEK